MEVVKRCIKWNYGHRFLPVTIAYIIHTILEFAFKLVVKSDLLINLPSKQFLFQAINL